MNWFFELISNPFLITALTGWFTSQTLKIFTHALFYKEWDIKRFWGDGGMPSSHTAFVSSIGFYAGFTYGFSSFQFALCGVFTAVICRDALGVRRETGKQAVILNEIKKLLTNEKIDDIKLKEFVGHTPVQVVVGLIWGFVVALVMNWVL